jgi:protein-disulfide isomerase
MIIRHPRSRPQRIVRVLCGLLAVFAAGCEQASESAAPGAAPPAAVSSDPVLGRVGASDILLADVEAPIALALYDLDMQRYRLLRQSLEIAALERLDASGQRQRIAELRLQPPSPPRLRIGIDAARTRPAADAPVTVLTFCNFESPHCVRLQNLLDQVLPLFEGGARHAARHFALPFHRNAELAALAAHCALEQGAYWRFHDLLLASSGPLNRGRLDAAARAATLDLSAFAECLDSQRYRAELASDSQAAAELGVGQLPGIFVNGLYAGSGVDAGQLTWLIESELQRLGIASPRQRAATGRSVAPLLLDAVLHSTAPGQGLAMLAPAAAPRRTGMFREGEAISHALILRRVTRDGIELVNDGRVEWLGFGDEHLVADDDEQPVAEAQPILRPHRAVPVTLDRDEVLVRLADRSGLHEVLETVPMKSGDYHQLRIQEIRPGSLYELLGLEAGDVILGVNEQPVHEAEIPLWDALEREREVRVRVMRRGGLARHYTYRFED